MQKFRAQLQAESGGALEDNVVPYSKCSLSCLMRIATEAPEELSNLNEIIDVWQRK